MRLPFGFVSGQPAEEADGDTLIKAEDVFIERAIRCRLSLLSIAVQIDDVNSAEDTEQFASHQAERDVVEIPVIRHETDHAAAGLVDLPLGERMNFT